MVVPHRRKFACLAVGDENAFTEMTILDTAPRNSRYADEEKETQQAADN